MTSTLTDLRAGLAVRLRTLGIAALATPTSNPIAPCALVLPKSIDFDLTFGRQGGDEYAVVIRILAGSIDEVGSQLLLDSYCAASGSTSVKEAVQGDTTLAGESFDLRVLRMENYGGFAYSDVTYLGADFPVQLFAN